MTRALGIAAVVLNAIFVIAYPLAVFYGLLYLPTRSVSIVILALLAPDLAWRFRKADRATFWSVVRLPIAILLLLIGGFATGDQRFLLALPVLINLVLLLEFGSTLRAGATPMIERFARMQVPELPPASQRHCRRWTAIWCGFFVLNGTSAAILALAAPIWWWTVYTGLIAYLLMGLMFAGERVTRPRHDAPAL